MLARLALVTALFSQAYAEGKTKNLVIIHTNDLHSQIEGSGPDAMVTPEIDDDPVKGHFARLSYKIKSLRAEALEQGMGVILVDAGDFYSGSMFHTLGPNPTTREIPEMEFFHDMGYDAITLGNHEFDAGIQGLTTMLNKAKSRNMSLPLVATNIVLPPGSPLGAFTSEKGNQSVFMTKCIEKIVKTAGGDVRVAILGALGPDGAMVSKLRREGTSFIGMNDLSGAIEIDALVNSIQKQVTEARENGADVVILLLHGGSPEDTALAGGVRGLDVIISGHTHQRYLKKVGATILSQAGYFGRYLGRLTLHVSKTSAPVKDRSGHFEMDDRTPMDPTYLKVIERQKDAVIGTVTSFPYHASAGRWAYPLVKAYNQPYGIQTIAMSAVRSALGKYLPNRLDVYFSFDGLIRAGYPNLSGEPYPYQFSDIFRVLSLGQTPSGTWGNQPVQFFLTKQDVRDLITFTAEQRIHNKSYGISLSSDITYRQYGEKDSLALFDFRLRGESFEKWPDLLSLATNIYAYGYLGELYNRRGRTFVTRNKNGDLAPVAQILAPPEAELWMEALRDQGQVETGISADDSNNSSKRSEKK